MQNKKIIAALVAAVVLIVLTMCLYTCGTQQSSIQSGDNATKDEANVTAVQHETETEANTTKVSSKEAQKKPGTKKTESAKQNSDIKSSEKKETTYSDTKSYDAENKSESSTSSNKETVHVSPQESYVVVEDVPEEGELPEAEIKDIGDDGSTAEGRDSVATDSPPHEDTSEDEGIWLPIIPI